MAKFTGVVPEKRFKSKEAASPEEYLNAAESLHPFLEKHKTMNEEGIRWIDSVPIPGFEPTGKEDLSLYTGSAGLAYFYLELYKATGNKEYENIALKAAHYLCRNWEIQITSSAALLGPECVTSIFLGITSIGQVLAQFYKNYAGNEFSDAVRAIAYKSIELADQNGDILSWGKDKSVLMGGGTVIYLYRTAEMLNDPGIFEAANKAADGILAAAIEDERGGLAWTSYAHPGQTRVPNFECGTAGIGLVLADAYEASGDERYLNAAKEAAKHIKVLAVPVGDGFLIPYHDNKNEKTLFYVSTCHGPAGTSRLFYKLYKLTGDEQYLEDIRGLYRGLKAIGVPEVQSSGYWNTVGICCGTAGVLQFFINLALVTGDEDARDSAIAAGNILLGTAAAQDAGIAWPFAFERINPDTITVSITYGTGSTGVAVALIQLYLLLKGKYNWDRFFDDPYPAVLE